MVWMFLGISWRARHLRDNGLERDWWLIKQVLSFKQKKSFSTNILTSEDCLIDVTPFMVKNKTKELSQD